MPSAQSLALPRTSTFLIPLLLATHARPSPHCTAPSWSFMVPPSAAFLSLCKIASTSPDLETCKDAVASIVPVLQEIPRVFSFKTLAFGQCVMCQSS